MPAAPEPPRLKRTSKARPSRSSSALCPPRRDGESFPAAQMVSPGRVYTRWVPTLLGGIMKRNYVKLRVEQLERRDCPAPVPLPQNIVAGGYTWKVVNNTFAIPPGTGLGIRDATK